MEINYYPPDVNTSVVNGIEQSRLINITIPAIDLDLITAIALINSTNLGCEIVKAIQEYILAWYENSGLKHEVN